jgi:3-oxoacyl-[acyl-carrier-protein] synthase II
MTAASPTGTGIIITGVGLVTCLGLSAAETWANVTAGKSGMGSMPALEQRPAGGDKPGGNGGQAPELPPAFMPGRPREVRYLRRAIDEAMRQASLDVRSIDPARIGCILGTTLHGMRQGGHFLRTGDYAPLCSFLAAHTIDQCLHGLPVEGLRATTCSACSSGLGAIALGVTLLRAGALDVVIAGGYDPVSEYAYAGFDSMRLVEPGRLRPFCKGREGMKLAEGYAIVVLERWSTTASPLAEIRGVGESADAHHLTQPHPEGEGALRAIEQALRGSYPSEIGLISAHATATPNNDAAEHAAFSRAFGTALHDIPVVAFKSHVGHTLGAAGSTELILSLLARREGLAPPTANITRAELEFPDLGILECSRRARICATLNASLGFGGANTCIVLGEPRPTRHEHPNLRDVFITGVGFLAPGMIGAEALAQCLTQHASPAPTGMLKESEYAHLINARRVRRMSEYSKLTLAATALALRHAGVSDVPAFAESCSALLGSMHGGALFCRDYYTEVVRDGMGAANPVLFAEGVPNAASAQLSLMLGIKGSCQTIIGSRTAGLDALRLATLRIATGACDRIIVGAAEEDADVLTAAYRHAGLSAPHEAPPARPFSETSGFHTSCGAASLILECADSMQGRRALAKLTSTSSAAAGAARLKASIARVLAELGDPVHLVCSANGTWIDREEAAGIALSNDRRGRPAHVMTPGAFVNEMFSVGPLAAIAGTLASGTARTNGDRLGFIVSDFTGAVSGVALAWC